MKPRRWVAVAFALAGAIACTSPGLDPPPTFCGRLAGAGACPEKTDCDPILSGTCKAAISNVQPSIESAASDCIASGICSGTQCLGRALLLAGSTPEHATLASKYCAQCAAGAPGCEAGFYKKGTGAPGAVVLPYSGAIAARVTDACTTDPGCDATFYACASSVIADALAPLGDAAAKCLTDAFRVDETKTTPGGPTVLTCTAKNCTGCCRNDKCEDGKSGPACGAAGAQCETCGAGESCNAGRCDKPCSPDTCIGCCDASGKCQEGTAAPTCGAGGVACKACTGAFVCSSRQCIDASCKTNCTSGCCSSAGCQTGNTTAACGAGGNVCAVCGAGRTCTSSVCTLNPASLWDVVMVYAEMPAVNKSAGAWDGFGGLPDPFAKVFTSEGASTHTAQTATVNDTLTPFWVQTTVTGVRASELEASFSVEVWDADTAFNDYMGGCKIPLLQDAFGGGLFTATCPETATGVSFKVYFRVTPHP